MNILYINHYAGSKKHGMAFRPYYLAKEWLKSGHKVTIVAASHSHLRNAQPNVSQSFTEETVDGILYNWLKVSKYSSNGIRRFINICQFVLNLFNNASRYIDSNPDVVIASSTYPMDIWPARFIAKRAGARLIFELHDVWPQSLTEAGGLNKFHPFVLLCGLAEKVVYKSADSIVSMLPAIHKHCATMSYDLSKVSIVSNGADFSEWDSSYQSAIPKAIKDEIDLARSKKFRIICYTGAHGIPNNLDNLLDAAKALVDARIMFILVGNGNHKAELTKRVKLEGIENIRMFDSVPKNLIPSILEASDIAFIGAKKQPLYQHGISPNKIMDYMMSSTPIISAIEAGNDPVSEAKCGITVAAENPTLLANALESMCKLSDKELSLMGAAGKLYAQNNYNYEMLASKFIDALQEGA
jgi:glycosyltransferase involved in cell wall biosynthesis